MRHFIKFLILFTIPLTLILSCKKDISLSPVFFQPTTFTTPAQLVSQLAGVYNPMEMDAMYAQGLWGYLEAGADESFRRNASSTSTGFFELYNTNFSSTESTIANNWKWLYVGIERANVILDDIDQVQMDESLRKQIKGQTIFLRAYYLYLLASRYGDVPLKIIPTTDMGTNFNIPRTDKRTVYNFVISEMAKADTMVQTMPQVQSTYTVTQTAVEGVLARVCLSMAGNPINDASKYKDALFWAQKVINSGVHSLNSVPLSQYPGTPAYARVFINNMQNNVNDKNIAEDMLDAGFLNKSTTAGFLVTQTLGANMGVYCPDASASAPIGFSGGIYRAYNKLYRLYASGDQRRDWAISPYTYKNGLTDKYYYLSVIFTGGGGSGASATAYTSSSGAITSVVVDNPGSGYTSAPTISFSSYINSTVNTGVPPQAVTAAANIATATAVVSGGKVTAVTVTKGGAGYPTAYDRCVGKWRREYEVNLTGITRLQNNTSCNFPIIRYADVLLMAAEADLKVNGSPSQAAIGYYNQVRRRAYGYSPTTAVPGVDVTTFTMQDIMDERSRELCFEGVRRQDLIRWGQLSNAMQAVLNDNSVYAPSGYLTAANLAPTNFLASPAKFLLFPIPANELSLDQALTQNPGW